MVLAESTHLATPHPSKGGVLRQRVRAKGCSRARR